MDQPEPFDDPGPPIAEPPRRIRRILTAVVLVTLIASIVVLAFTSGRGLVPVAPVEPPASPGPDAPATVVAPARLAIVDADGHLSTTDATGGSVRALGEPGVAYSFPTWSPDGGRIAVLGAGGRGADRCLHDRTGRWRDRGAADGLLERGSARRSTSTGRPMAGA